MAYTNVHTHTQTHTHADKHHQQAPKTNLKQIELNSFRQSTKNSSNKTNPNEKQEKKGNKRRMVSNKFNLVKAKSPDGSVC